MKFIYKILKMKIFLLGIFFTFFEIALNSSNKYHDFTKLEKKIDIFTELITFDPSTI